MNWVDILLIAIVLLAIWMGWSQGFVHGMLSLLTWAGSLVLGYVLHPYLASLLNKLFVLGVWLLPVSFIIMVIVARLILGWLAGFLIRLIPVETDNNKLNKFLGLIPGAINGWIYAIVISALLLALPFKDVVTSATRESRYATQFAMQSEWANRKLAPVFNDAVRQTLNNLTVKPGSNEKVELSFKYDKAVPKPNLEAQMLQMVNAERQKHGLKPVQADPELTTVARAHSQDMFTRGYFAHESPEGKDPFDRMRTANIKFYAAGENLALAQTLEIAHNGLMNSPGHRANILNPAFGRLGIGVLDGGFYGLMISQEFRD
ncbi:MAG TPA: CvpA family protein [Chitinophagaceae bacterium]